MEIESREVILAPLSIYRRYKISLADTATLHKRDDGNWNLVKPWSHQIVRPPGTANLREEGRSIVLAILTDSEVETAVGVEMDS